MQISASAPTKIILCGEHYVVYGAPALTLPVDMRTYVSVRRSGRMEIIAQTGNRIINDETIERGVKAIVGHICPNEKLRVELKYSDAPKGMGNSASSSAALSLALFSLVGKKPTYEELFNAVQEAEKIAHGSPSGIDAHTVIVGKPTIFRRFSERKFSEFSFALPNGTTLMVVDTSRGKTCSTADMVRRFAEKHGIFKKPEEMGERERRDVFAEYERIWEKMSKALSDGDAAAIGKTMLDNHALLRKSGVASDGIERAVELCMENGAYGAKLTGAGGEGGAVIALAGNSDVDAIIKAAKNMGFNAFPISIADRGVSLEND
ncbi:MAG: hypothetical protein QXP42_06150 [Candidatus Micrarchaeia archaeon]